MKYSKFLLSGLIVLMSLSLSAQNSFNRFYVGGSAGYTYDAGSYSYTSSLVNSDYTSIGYSIVPVFGYFVKEQFMIGIGVNYEVENTYQEKITQSNLISPIYNVFDLKTGNAGINLLAKYHWKLSEKVMIAATGGIGGGVEGAYIMEQDSSENYFYKDFTENGINYITAFVYPELQVYLTNNFGLNLSCSLIRYVFEMEKSALNNEENLHNFDFSLKPENWNFGLFYRF